MLTKIKVLLYAHIHKNTRRLYHFQGHLPAGVRDSAGVRNPAGVCNLAGVRNSASVRNPTGVRDSDGNHGRPDPVAVPTLFKKSGKKKKKTGRKKGKERKTGKKKERTK